MNINEEREAFEDWLACNSIHDHVYVRGERTDENGNYYSEYVYLAWSAWQAAKAQAVPEGFVLVKKVHPDAIVHNQGLGLFKECQVIYGWDSKSKDFKEALNKGFYHGVKLGAKAVLETAMIEAQEPTND